MTHEKISIENHIARFCSSKHIAEDGSIAPTAFLPREKEVDVSVNWIEWLHCDSRELQVKRLSHIYFQKRLPIDKKSKIAFFNIGCLQEKVVKESTDKRQLDVLHTPSKEDTSHAGIYNLKTNDFEIAEIISDAIMEDHKIAR